MSVSTSTPSSEAKITATCWLADSPGAIEAAVARGGDLGEVDGHAAEFDAGREALDQAPRQHDERREQPDGFVAGA